MDDSLVRALSHERLANARRINLLRFIGVTFLFALFGTLGVILGKRSWQGNLSVLAPYWIVTTALFLASHRLPAVARLAVWAIPVLDMPMLFLVQWMTFPNTPNPGAVAGYTMGVYVLLLLVQALSLDARTIYFAAFIGATLEGVLQHLAGIDPGAIVSTYVIMGFAAVSCAYGSRRISDLILRVVKDLRGVHRAESAVIARDEFISVASHELRSPLTTLQLELQSLLRAAHKPNGVVIGEPVMRRLQNANAHSQRLGRLIHNLLDVSRLSAGQLQLELEDVDLAEVAAHVVDMAKESMARAICVCTTAAPGPVVGAWDRQRLEQVLTNLLENAMKYGARNPIEVTVSGDDQCAELVVRDHGIGIATEDQQRVFERFERANPSRKQPGLGLGLWITSELVRAHGGTIRVESQVNQGATFTIRLPRRPAAASGGPDMLSA
ncbi:MAG TPA: HAMP domain-containing sensor histidine kinase [Polyangia bacterium]|jgi:signal transduction histidine kinase|nr:HAMP domain-containing sensor histidine kinase [Polyangia bacterium]